MNAVNLPVAADAALPQRYEAARSAIAECERIDECKSWSDKAAALASYARQAKDDSLRVMSIRIQARAERRCGELLKQIEPARGHENGSAPTRSGAAKDAGLSEHQRKTALRIANVLPADFDRQVESAKPPTVTQLADQGRMSRVRTPDDLTAEYFKAACTALHQFATYCDTHGAIETAQTFGAADVEMARRCVSTLDRWLDLFVSNLSR